MKDHKLEKETEQGQEQEQTNGNLVQSVDRALTLLEILGEEGNPMSISSIAKRVNLKISTVHRLLATLIHKGFVEQEDDSSKYKLSFKLMSLGQASVYPVDLRAKARPFLEKLVELCNETANLSILEGTEVVYIDQVESTNMVIVRMFSTIGSRRQIHCTGSGKVLLAHLAEDKRESILESIELKHYTDETITDVNILRKELARIKKQGYALDMGERVIEMRCVAAPIFRHDGEVIAAISVSGPSSRITSYYLNNELIDILRNVANKLSKSLGYNGNGF